MLSFICYLLLLVAPPTEKPAVSLPATKEVKAGVMTKIQATVGIDAKSIRFAVFPKDAQIEWYPEKREVFFCANPAKATVYTLIAWVDSDHPQAECQIFVAGRGCPDDTVDPDAAPSMPYLKEFKEAADKDKLNGTYDPALVKFMADLYKVTGEMEWGSFNDAYSHLKARLKVKLPEAAMLSLRAAVWDVIKPLDRANSAEISETLKKVAEALERLSGPAPNPDKDDGTAPISDPGLWVMIVYEQQELPKLPASQQSVIFGQSVRDYIQSKGGKFLATDQNASVTTGDAAWGKMLALKRQSVPWLVISKDGKSGCQVPLPKTIDETMALLKKYGG